ncbi:hypothetical protein HDE79_000378 [Rhodanobacter sp. MP1X3]|nr:hypothetical protein [Rhodanobacter sp. MP1X3]
MSLTKRLSERGQEGASTTLIESTGIMSRRRREDQQHQFQTCR